MNLYLLTGNIFFATKENVYELFKRCPVIQSVIFAFFYGVIWFVSSPQPLGGTSQVGELRQDLRFF